MQFDFGLPRQLFAQHFTTDFSLDAALSPNEQALISGASDKRVREFSAGRWCARQALQQLGCEPIEILRGPNKEPLWPTGVVGAISHSHALAGAVVARANEVAGIGLDIERLGRVTPAMWHLLFTAPEQEFLQSLSAQEQEFYATLFFSWKECFYKLQFPITGHELWFLEVEIRLNNSQFQLTVLKEFPEKRLLPMWVDLQHATYQDQLIGLCVLEALPFSSPQPPRTANSTPAVPN